MSLKGIRSSNFLFHIWIELDQKITFVKKPLTWDAWIGQERPPNIERLPNFSLYFIFFQDPSKFGRWQQSAWRAYISRPSHRTRIYYISNKSSNVELSFDILQMSVALVLLEQQSISNSVAAQYLVASPGQTRHLWIVVFYRCYFFVKLYPYMK